MNPKLILLVEDNPDDADLTLRALKKSRLVTEVVMAQDGAEALDYLLGTGLHAQRDLNIMPTLVLMDLKMPRLDGLEVLRRLRANARTQLLPVVILTSSREQEDLLNSYQLGANSYIRKPVDFTQFTDTVQQLGTYWLELNEPPPGAEGSYG